MVTNSSPPFSHGNHIYSSLEEQEEEDEMASSLPPSLLSDMGLPDDSKKSLPQQPITSNSTLDNL